MASFQNSSQTAASAEGVEKNTSGPRRRRRRQGLHPHVVIASRSLAVGLFSLSLHHSAQGCRRALDFSSSTPTSQKEREIEKKKKKKKKKTSPEEMTRWKPRLVICSFLLVWLALEGCVCGVAGQDQRSARDSAAGGPRRQRRHRNDKAKLVRQYLKKNGRLEGMIRLVDGQQDHEGLIDSFFFPLLLSLFLLFHDSMIYVYRPGRSFITPSFLLPTIFFLFFCLVQATWRYSTRASGAPSATTNGTSVKPPSCAGNWDSPTLSGRRTTPCTVQPGVSDFHEIRPWLTRPRVAGHTLSRVTLDPPALQILSGWTTPTAWEASGT